VRGRHRLHRQRPAGQRRDQPRPSRSNQVPAPVTLTIRGGSGSRSIRATQRPTSSALTAGSGRSGANIACQVPLASAARAIGTRFCMNEVARTKVVRAPPAASAASSALRVRTMPVPASRCAPWPDNATTRGHRAAATACAITPASAAASAWTSPASTGTGLSTNAASAPSRAAASAAGPSRRSA